MSIPRFFFEKDYCTSNQGGGAVIIPDAEGKPIYLFCDNQSLGRMMDAGYKVIINESLDNDVEAADYLFVEFRKWLEAVDEHIGRHGAFNGLAILEK